MITIEGDQIYEMEMGAFTCQNIIEISLIFYLFILIKKRERYI